MENNNIILGTIAMGKIFHKFRKTVLDRLKETHLQLYAPEFVQNFAHYEEGKEAVNLIEFSHLLFKAFCTARTRNAKGALSKNR